MKYYSDLLALGCFTRDELCDLTGNYNTAGTLLKSYLQKKYIRKVKRDLYVAMNLADNQPAVSKYHIACKITKSAYISHHAAFEYYGCANQVSYQVEVSSETPFTPFSFEGNAYTYIASRIAGGVSTRQDGVRITDVERTILDGINDFEKIMGLEELLRCLPLIPAVKEEKLLEYLTAYKKQIMYQKAGFILQHFQREFRLSKAFFTECAGHIGKSTRYFTTKRQGVYNKEWRLIVPKALMQIIMKGTDEDADV